MHSAFIYGVRNAGEDCFAVRRSAANRPALGNAREFRGTRDHRGSDEVAGMLGEARGGDERIAGIGGCEAICVPRDTITGLCERFNRGIRGARWNTI